MTWPAAGQRLVSESARHGLREPDRLEAPAAALAAQRRIAPQTATVLLRLLQAKVWSDGPGRFRAFAG